MRTTSIFIRGNLRRPRRTTGVNFLSLKTFKCSRVRLCNDALLSFLPQKKRQPAENKGPHYDAQCSRRFMLGPPGFGLLSYRRTWK